MGTRRAESDVIILHWGRGYLRVQDNDGWGKRGPMRRSDKHRQYMYVYTVSDLIPLGRQKLPFLNPLLIAILCLEQREGFSCAGQRGLNPTD